MIELKGRESRCDSIIIFALWILFDDEAKIGLGGG